MYLVLIYFVPKTRKNEEITNFFVFLFYYSTSKVVNSLTIKHFVDREVICAK